MTPLRAVQGVPKPDRPCGNREGAVSHRPVDQERLKSGMDVNDISGPQVSPLSGRKR